MAHSISGILTEARPDPDAAAAFDLIPCIDRDGVMFIPLDHCFTTYWSRRLNVPGEYRVPDGFPADFPRHTVLRHLLDAVGCAQSHRFAIVMTEYFGGVGEQWAVLVDNDEVVPQHSINDVLHALGVRADRGQDAFSAFGFDVLRSNPARLHIYSRVCRMYRL